jgi:hypothetical protein
MSRAAATIAALALLCCGAVIACNESRAANKNERGFLRQRSGQALRLGGRTALRPAQESQG